MNHYSLDTNDVVEFEIADVTLKVKGKGKVLYKTYLQECVMAENPGYYEPI